MAANVIFLRIRGLGAVLIRTRLEDEVTVELGKARRKS